jgi:hypothetical protein
VKFIFRFVGESSEPKRVKKLTKILSISDDNKIKYLNGRAFGSLTKLQAVFLFSNDCINRNFRNQTGISLLAETVTESCGFCEKDLKIEVNVCKVSEQMKIIGANGRESFSELLKAQKYQTDLIAELKSNLMFEKMKTCEELSGKQNEIYELKMKELRNEIDRKNHENDRLSNELESKITENNAVKLKIKHLERKIKDLS